MNTVARTLLFTCRQKLVKYRSCRHPRLTSSARATSRPARVEGVHPQKEPTAYLLSIYESAEIWSHDQRSHDDKHVWHKSEFPNGVLPGLDLRLVLHSC